jgi:hypothetical protein
MATTNYNQVIADLQKKSTKTKKDLEFLLKKYEDLLHEINAVYLEERMAVMSSRDGEGRTEDDLRGFYKLIQVLKRNRDIIGSTLRGFSNLRPTSEFKFVEEDIMTPVSALEKKTSSQIIIGDSEINDNFLMSDEFISKTVPETSEPNTELENKNEGINNEQE